MEFIRSKVLGINRVHNEYVTKIDEEEREFALRIQREKEEREKLLK